MKYLILGTGLLGSHLGHYLKAPTVAHKDCDVTNRFDVQSVLAHFKPDTVINATGIIPQRKGYTLEELFKVNTLGPRLLREECDLTVTKLIQVSTNCVYASGEGNYTEDMYPSPDDNYGLSKLLGEVEFPHLTLRVSIAGYPDPKKYNLFGWAQRQKKVIGFDQVIWNGLTTWGVAEKIKELDECEGTVHLYGETTNKKDLLELAAKVWGWKLKVTPESSVTDEVHKENKTLSSVYDFGKITLPLEEQMGQMRDAWQTAGN